MFICIGLCKHPLFEKLRLWKLDVDRQIGVGNSKYGMFGGEAPPWPAEGAFVTV